MFYHLCGTVWYSENLAFPAFSLNHSSASLHTLYFHCICVLNFYTGKETTTQRAVENADILPPHPTARRSARHRRPSRRVLDRM